jgi:hypothetical protein
MVTKLFPDRLRPGSHVRVIAPSLPLGIISPQTRDLPDARFDKLGGR